MNNLLDRFLRYVQIDTQSSGDSGLHPSTSGQMELAEILQKELQELGLSRINLSEQGYVTAELPANTDRELPVIGFLAHLDTSPDTSGKNVKPLVFPEYDGKDLVINTKDNIILSVHENPELQNYMGQTIITSDGTTLLGADDKAGIAIIMHVLEILAKNEGIKHGKIMVAFTPDEEIGEGADYFDVAGFGADFAYTVDGGPLGELEYETFNAAEAKIEIKGVNIHPGTAYMRMHNAILSGMEMHSMLPVNERPEYTRGYEGFYHLTRFTGTVESVQMNYIIRDHDRSKFEEKKAHLQSCVDFLNEKYPFKPFHLRIHDQYYNMKEIIEPVYHIVSLAEQSMLKSGISPQIKPVRGGTDGARLSFMGLPCPNIFTGGHNFHSCFEYISLESMEAASRVIIDMVKQAAAD